MTTETQLDLLNVEKTQAVCHSDYADFDFYPTKHLTIENVWKLEEILKEYLDAGGTIKLNKAYSVNKQITHVY